jgi:Uma2 family endonuclease
MGMVAPAYYTADMVRALPADISWSSDTLVQPDLFVADSAEVRTLDWNNVKSLQLVIEVLGPTTTRYDRFTKRRLYQEVEVPVYWIVDPEDRAVEVWTPDATLPRVEREDVIWDSEGASQHLQRRVLCYPTEVSVGGQHHQLVMNAEL